MLKVKVDYNFSGLVKNTKKRKDEARFALTEQVVKDSNYYVPRDTGELMVSSLIASDFEEGKAVWDTPYARKLYWNPDFNFSKDVNPNARGMWFEEAKSNRLRHWRKIVRDNY